MICGFFGSSSTQAGYRFSFSIEGNALENELKRMGDVGRLFEMGTSIGITRRNFAKYDVIQRHYCEFQYKRWLKTKWKDHKVRWRTSGVATVLTYEPPSSRYEVILKYGDGDISESSLVFRYSKDDEAERRTTTFTIHNTKPYGRQIFSKIWNYRKEKCPSGLVERWLLSNETFIAHKVPKTECNFTKDL